MSKLGKILLGILFISVSGIAGYAFAVLFENFWLAMTASSLFGLENGFLWGIVDNFLDN